MSKSVDDPSGIERVAGSSAMTLAATGIAAVATGPLAPFIPAISGVLAQFLPILTTSLASTRQAERVQEAFKAVNAELEEHAELLRKMSDEQYKLINETVVAILQTTDPAKIEYLKRAVSNGLQLPELIPLHSEVLARVVRDISAAEADFVLKNFQYQFISLDAAADDHPPETRYVARDSGDAVIVSGLMALGLLIPAPAVWDRIGMLQFANITVYVIGLLRNPEQEPE
ncbi:TPA: hypothetical protein L4V00_001827 [Pseudomonas aeruginosa]|nr:hypothetical protein [Pseudomonas aeruginosa]HBO4704414.1 hypothetical protein [Pseudomonas aeruginosa]